MDNTTQQLVRLIACTCGLILLIWIVTTMLKVVTVWLINTYGVGYLLFAAKFFPAAVLALLVWVGFQRIDHSQLDQIIRATRAA